MNRPSHIRHTRSHHTLVARLAVAAFDHPRVVLVATAIYLFAALALAPNLKLDALPDITGKQVLVLTNAPGYTPEEVERLITRPVESALGGIAGTTSQRSISRYGISSITVVFADDTDLFRARQLVQERLATVSTSLPDGIEAPEMGPITGGLGEIFQFTVASPRLSAAELYELVELHIAPSLRQTPGIVEVNTWGGERRTVELRANPARLASHNLSFTQLRDALTASLGSSSGSSLRAGTSHVLLRGVARPRTPDEFAAIMLPTSDTTPPVRLGDIATIRDGSLARTGAATANGGGETVYVMAQMLNDANALDTTKLLRARLDTIRPSLPQDVTITIAYDRADLVSRTLKTLFSNLTEGGLLVIAVLFLLLGSLRAGLIVALTIPLSMAGAVAGMTLFGIPGNLMSLGAIDFGLLVDGAVVLIENIFHHTTHFITRDNNHYNDHDSTNDHHNTNDHDINTELARSRLSIANIAGDDIRQVIAASARPVFFGILVIALVYLPILMLTGVDGRLFRPMAITVVLALLFALILSLTFVPAAAATFLRSRDIPRVEPLIVRVATRLYRPTLDWALTHPAPIALFAIAQLALAAWLFATASSEFVPQLDEGDLVIQTTRAPDTSLEAAITAATTMEATLLRDFNEVRAIASRIGSPAIATDIMGIEQADIFVSLAPRNEWQSGRTRDELIAAMQARLTDLDPTAEYSFTQPIQMRFNELIGGDTSDVAISIFGPDLIRLRETGEAVAEALRTVPGAADVRVRMPPAVPLAEIHPRPLDAARFALTPRDVLDTTLAIRAGIPVGDTFDGMIRVPVRLRLDGDDSAFALRNTVIPIAQGNLIPLTHVAHIAETATPSLVNRELGARRVVVAFNVRERDLGTVVSEAQTRVATNVPLDDGTRLVWGGQYQSLNEARARLTLVIPIVIVAIFVLLILAFSRVKPALFIFLNVPFASVGGIALLTLRNMPVSISAAVGFIALSGIAVLNGLVLMSRVLANESAGTPGDEAMRLAAQERMRPVLVTAFVAALGFVPMMLATGAGAEIQRPLATVVVGGLFTSTLLTLIILPVLYATVARARTPRQASQPRQTPQTRG